MRRQSLRLCLVTDRGLVPKERFLETIDEAISGGVTMVQLRDKGPGRSTREVYEDGLALRALCAARGVPLVVNDRLDLALALKADGLHLGQGDLPAARARELWPRGAMLGISASNVAEAIAAGRDGADYIGVGAVFPTASKGDAELSGLAELGRIVAAVSIPVVAIGGITVGNARRVMATGCDGIAVISAIWAAPDPRAAAARLSGEPVRR